MSQNGKGDTPRPLSVTQETYKNNYDRIFGKKEDVCEYSGLLNTASYAKLEEPTPSELYDTTTSNTEGNN